MRRTTTRFATLIGFIAAGVCHGQDCAPAGHHDIDFEAQSSKIVTGIAILDCPIDSPADQCTVSNDFGWRTHKRAYHEDPCDPFFLDDPGMFAQEGSGLPAGSTLGFDILADLLYWNGTGTPQFGSVPNHETLRIRLGGQSRIAGTGTGFVSGFFFAVIDSLGGLHVHISFFLQGADGNAIPAQDVSSCGLVGDGVEPTNGLYLLQLRFKSNNGSLANSDPVWIVFDNAIGGCMDCEGIVHVGSQIAHDRPATDLDFDRHVDSSDFDRFKTCATGPKTPWIDPCCQYADFDHDGDVDMDDFAMLQRCYAGPNAVADPNCVQ